MFEIGKRAEVVTHKYGHYLTVAQSTLAVAVTVFLILKKKIFCTFGCKIIEKFIHNTENFYNFILGNHRLYFCKLLFFTCKVTKYLRYYQLLGDFSYTELTLIYIAQYPRLRKLLYRIMKIVVWVHQKLCRN